MDDGSTDNTQELLKSYENKIKIFTQKNAGVSSARNLGIKKAKYDWIAFLDSDDEWLEDKLEKQVQYHKKNIETKFSYTAESWVRDGKTVNQPKKFEQFSGKIFDKILTHTTIGASTVMMHKDIFTELGYFDESLEICEDYDLWLRVAKKYKICLLEEKLTIKYGGADDQLSTKYWGMDRFRIKALYKHKENLEAKKVLIQKCDLLIKGAKKHGNIELQKECEWYLK